MKHTPLVLPVFPLVLTLVQGCQPGDEEPTAQAAGPGKSVWEQTCAVCHRNGIAGAPAMGNKQAWKPRLAKGTDILIQHAIEGFEGEEGIMPAKGGNTALSNEQVADAVKFMLSRSQ